MAIAIGSTGDIRRDGFVWGGGFGEEGQQTALNICRGFEAPSAGFEMPSNATKAQRLCKVVAVFRDKCFAIAFDGDARTPATGFGWAVENDLRSAEAVALNKCMAAADSARRNICKVTYSHCDGAD